MIQSHFIGKKHHHLLAWLRDTWIPAGPPVCFLEGFPGVGKSKLARELSAAASVKVVAVEVPDSRSLTADDLLLHLGQAWSEAGDSTLADTITAGKDPIMTLARLLQNPVLIVMDEFQHAMTGEEARLSGPLADLFQRLARNAQARGRILLLTNRFVERARWSEAFEKKSLEGLDADDGAALLGRMLADDGREADVPPDERPAVAHWLGGNPRALNLLVVGLRYDPLDELVRINPDTWKHADLAVSPELIQKIERQMLERILGRLDEAFLAALHQLAVFRKPFKNKALEVLFPPKETLAHFKAELINQFLMEQHGGWFSLHPIVREIGLQKLLEHPSDLKKAHEQAARHYTRHFYARDKTERLGTLGAYFAEARYHLVRAGNQAELAQVARYFFDYLSASFNFGTPVPKEPELLHERIEVLAAVLESPGPVGLECHLARLYEARRQEGDLDKAIRHLRRVLGPKAVASVWLLAGKLLNQNNQRTEAIQVLQTGIKTIPAAELYGLCAELLAQNNQREEAIKLLREGIGKVSASQNVFALYQSCAELLAQNNQREEAIKLLREGIDKVPFDKGAPMLYTFCSNLLLQDGQREEAIKLLRSGLGQLPDGIVNGQLSMAYVGLLSEDGRRSEAISLLRRDIRILPSAALYQSCAELLAKNNQRNEAIKLLQEGIGKVPVGSVFSLYQSCAELLAQNNQREEAIKLLREGIGKVPASQNVFSLYQSCAELLAQNNQPDEAIRLLREGIGKVPASQNVFALYQSCAELLCLSQQWKDATTLLWEGVEKVPMQFQGYKLAEALLSLEAAAGNEVRLRSLAAKTSSSNQNLTVLANSFLLQISERWELAAQVVAEGRSVLHYAVEMLCWLGVDTPVKALQAFEKIPEKTHEKDQAYTWLMAFVQLQSGDLPAARHYLSLFLGEDWAGPDAGIRPALLRLWDEADTPWGRGDLAYYFPILPAALTGLSAEALAKEGLPHSFSRRTYAPPVLPMHLKTLPVPEQPSVMEPDTPAKMLLDKRARGAFDVFLCHNSADKSAVKKIGEHLKQFGLLPWLDEWELQPGKSWQRVLEAQIGSIQSVAVFVGPDGIGPWQHNELDAFLRQFVKRDIPVIPVLLPECGEKPVLPMFLESFTWVDFRKQDPNPYHRLVWGISGQRPEDLPVQALGRPAELLSGPGLIEEVRAAVREEIARTREALLQQADDNQRAVLLQLTEAQVTIVQSLSQGIEAARIPQADMAELLEAMRDLKARAAGNAALSAVVDKLPGAFEDTRLDISHKLKLSLPIIPLLLAYEGEVDWNSSMNISTLIKKMLAKLRG